MEYCTCDICRALEGKLTDQQLALLKRRLKDDPRYKMLMEKIEEASKGMNKMWGRR